jgi:hypothetical protein
VSDTIDFGADEVRALTEKRATKIRYRVGSRYTYDPNTDERLGIKSDRPSPDGADAQYHKNGALKGTRTVSNKFIRRMFRGVAMKYGSRIDRKILEAQQLHASTRQASESGHEARRVLAAEIADRRAKRREGNELAPAMSRAERRAQIVPGRGARKRTAVQP